MQMFSRNIPVGTAPAEIFAFIPSRIHAVTLRAQSSVELGVGGVTVGSGADLYAGESISFGHKDFNPADPEYNTLSRLYAVAPSATSVRIFGWRF